MRLIPLPLHIIQQGIEEGLEGREIQQRITGWRNRYRAEEYENAIAAGFCPAGAAMLAYDCGVMEDYLYKDHLQRCNQCKRAHLDNAQDAFTREYQHSLTRYPEGDWEHLRQRAEDYGLQLAEFDRQQDEANRPAPVPPADLPPMLRDLLAEARMPSPYDTEE